MQRSEAFGKDVICEEAHFLRFPPQVGGFWQISYNFSYVDLHPPAIEDSKAKGHALRTIDMTVVEGFCLKCKTYGPIKDGQLIKMKNGRTRMAGSCSQNGCTGKISKIVS